MHVKLSLSSHTDFITNQDCFGKTDEISDKSSKNSSNKSPVCLDVGMDNFWCVCLCVSGSYPNAREKAVTPDTALAIASSSTLG